MQDRRSAGSLQGIPNPETLPLPCSASLEKLERQNLFLMSQGKGLLLLGCVPVLVLDLPSGRPRFAVGPAPGQPPVHAHLSSYVLTTSSSL